MTSGNQGHREIRISTNDEDGRADIIDRYFAKQIDKLLEYIKDGRAFGEMVTYCLGSSSKSAATPTRTW